jgi:hypothetical protein
MYSDRFVSRHRDAPLQASEGVNGTVAGTQAATALYVDAMLGHPVFGRVMRKADFKSSVSDMYVRACVCGRGVFNLLDMAWLFERREWP